MSCTATDAREGARLLGAMARESGEEGGADGGKMHSTQADRPVSTSRSIPDGSSQRRWMALQRKLRCAADYSK